VSKHTKPGSLQLVVQEKQEAKSNVNIQMQVQGLPERTSLFKCNFATTYFMEIWKGPEGSRAKFYESDFFVDEFTHDFNLELTDAVLCNAKKDCPIEFKFINRNQYSMINEEICGVVTTLEEIKKSEGQKLLAKNKEGKTLANLLLKTVEITDIPSFSDYLKEGVQISLIGAIDFSYSNGSAENPNSLHNVTSRQPN
jgi:hypothetical protein